MTYTQKPPSPPQPPSHSQQQPHQTDRGTPATAGNGTADQLYPFFDYYVPRNITTTIGQSAFLHCRTENLNDKSVSTDDESHGTLMRSVAIIFIHDTSSWPFPNPCGRGVASLENRFCLVERRFQLNPIRARTLWVFVLGRRILNSNSKPRYYVYC